MSELHDEARAKHKARADKILSNDPKQKVDASSWTPPEALNAGVRTGMRPVSKSSFKRGGEVDGEKPKRRADRKRRATGGKVGEEYENRNLKVANEERPGPKHDGGLKRGGRAHKMGGGPLASPISQGIGGQGRMDFSYPVRKGGGKVEGHAASCKCDRCMGGRTKHAKGGKTSLDGEMQGTRPTGGRIARKDGGGDWMEHAVKHPGALHKELGVPKGKKIPEKKLEKAEHRLERRKRANLAETFKRERKADGGELSGLDKQFRTTHTIDGVGRFSGRQYPGNLKNGRGFDSKEKADGLTEEFNQPNRRGEKRPVHYSVTERPASLEPPEGFGHKKGGRAERARGGKTDINIVIASPRDKPAAAPMPMPPRPPGNPLATAGGAPMGINVPPPSPMGALPPGAGPGGPQMPPPGMGRKRGGMVSMDGKAAGGGEGRLRKITEYGEK